MKTLTKSPRIYVACLASYNPGIPHGEWIEIGDDIDETWNEIRAILGNSPEHDAEEWGPLPSENETHPAQSIRI